VADDPIKVRGLVEFQRALKDLDGESQKQLRVVFNDAADLVASGARRLVPSRSGRARGSVRVLSTQRAARVAGGSARAPYYPFLDFGGSVGRKGSVRRPFLKDGRYIYATYGRRRDEFRKLLERGLVKLVRDAGLEIES
jgi:hypothetical protein